MTHTNTDNLLAVLGGFNYERPLILGFIIDGATREPNVCYPFPSGGAGAVFSRPAASQIANSLYTPLCPFTKANDMTIGRCAFALGIPLIDHPGFLPRQGAGHTAGHSQLCMEL